MHLSSSIFDSAVLSAYRQRGEVVFFVPELVNFQADFVNLHKRVLTNSSSELFF